MATPTGIEDYTGSDVEKRDPLGNLRPDVKAAENEIGESAIQTGPNQEGLGGGSTGSAVPKAKDAVAGAGADVINFAFEKARRAR
jgi:hypothetical protein